MARVEIPTWLGLAGRGLETVLRGHWRGRVQWMLLPSSLLRRAVGLGRQGPQGRRGRRGRGGRRGRQGCGRRRDVDVRDISASGQT